MWTPSERIKHPLPEVEWPTAEEAAESLWFSPIRLGPDCVLEQRTWVPAMVPWRATEEGDVTPEVLDWYGRFARGRPGAIVVEATGIRDIPSGPLLRIGHDRFLPGLRELVDTVRRESGGQTRLFIQLIDFLAVRRRPEPEKYFKRYLRLESRHRNAVGADDATPEEEVRDRLLALGSDRWPEVLDERELEDLSYGYRERVTDMHLEHVRELPRVLPGLFADAALRAREAGFDGVELHFAHAYTMASFLSATNTRDDGYGGSRENRVRLPVEVLEAVRERVGDGYVLGLRYLSDEIIEGGSGVEDAVFFGVELARAGADFLSVSRGGKFDDAKQPRIGEAVYPYTGRSGYECMPTVYSDASGPFGRNVDPTARIRAGVREAGLATPVVVAGGINNFHQAESILQREDADIVASARQTLADPDWFRKVRAGRGDEVRRCEFTNYCEALDQKHKAVTCKLWDRVDLDERGILLDPTGRRRLTAPEWDQVAEQASEPEQE